MSTASIESHDVSDNVEWLSRAGYTAKGIVYGIVGVLTAGAVSGWFPGGEVAGTRDALREIASQPFGTVLIVLMTVGLFGYVLWRLVQAFRDTEDKGDDATGFMQRAGFLISATMYAALGVYAASLAGWFSGGGGGQTKRDLTARLMSTDWGVWVVGAIGVSIIGVGLYQAYRAATRQFKDNWRTGEMTESQQRMAIRVSQVGVATRAITFFIIGGLTVSAAIDRDPGEAKGLGHALASLSDETHGVWLLGIVSIGLICYGIYCVINAIYRWMDV